MYENGQQTCEWNIGVSATNGTVECAPETASGDQLLAAVVAERMTARQRSRIVEQVQANWARCRCATPTLRCRRAHLFTMCCIQTSTVGHLWLRREAMRESEQSF